MARLIGRRLVRRAAFVAFVRFACAFVFVLFVAAPYAVRAQFTTANYVPWGVDEYEFFGLTKPQLAAKFKSRVEFRNEMQRACVSPQKGSCSGYDGPTFELTFEGGKVSRVQRVFVGCHESQYGPVLESKPAALRYFIANVDAMSKNAPLSATLSAKLRAARAELATTK
jgi:hypothetical protein